MRKKVYLKEEFNTGIEWQDVLYEGLVDDAISLLNEVKHTDLKMLRNEQSANDYAHVYLRDEKILKSSIAQGEFKVLFIRDYTWGNKNPIKYDTEANIPEDLSLNELITIRFAYRIWNRFITYISEVYNNLVRGEGQEISSYVNHYLPAIEWYKSLV